MRTVRRSSGAAGHNGFAGHNAAFPERTKSSRICSATDSNTFSRIPNSAHHLSFSSFKGVSGNRRNAHRGVSVRETITGITSSPWPCQGLSSNGRLWPRITVGRPGQEPLVIDRARGLAARSGASPCSKKQNSRFSLSKPTPAGMCGSMGSSIPLVRQPRRRGRPCNARGSSGGSAWFCQRRADTTGAGPPVRNPVDVRPRCLSASRPGGDPSCPAEFSK